MVMLDTFNSDNFGVVSLTTALDKIPYQPNWLGAMGLFEQVGITSTTAVVEERHNRLALVPTSARGTTETTLKQRARTSRSFVVPHIAESTGILAEEVQNIRAFGTEDVTETVAAKVNDYTVMLRNNIDVTKEYQRHGAIQGVTYDSDMSTAIYNFFTEFGITEQTEDFAFTTATTDIKGLCASVVRKIHTALGGDMIQGIVGLCGDSWFDAMVSHAKVEAAYDRWQDGRFLRTSQMGGAGYFAGPDGQPGFSFGGINFFNSRASIGGTAMIPTGQCRFFPVGVKQLFQEINSPADYIETVNTSGQAFYAKQERMALDKGILLEVQANPLIICTRPRALVKGTES